MSFLMRQVAHCDVCGHEWLTSKVPSHCAKCKSRKWNQEPGPLSVIREAIDKLPRASTPVGQPIHVKMPESWKHLIAPERTVEYEE